jgi:hypothetical protein
MGEKAMLRKGLMATAVLAAQPRATPCRVRLPPSTWGFARAAGLALADGLCCE